MDESIAKRELDELRQKLRQIDDRIIELVAQRMGLAKNIGLLKKQHSLPIMDPTREAFNNQRNHELARGQIPKPMIDELTNLLATWAREIQKMAR